MFCRLAAVSVSLTFLAACDRPVSFYAAHPVDRSARLQTCLSGVDNDSQDCRNAAQADYEARGIKAINGRAVVTSLGSQPAVGQSL